MIQFEEIDGGFSESKEQPKPEPKAAEPKKRFSIADLKDDTNEHSFTIENSSVESIKENVSQETTSPTIEKHKDKKFKISDAENIDSSLQDFDEKGAEEEAKEAMSEEDVEDFSELIVEGFDWGTDKLFRMFGYKTHDNKAMEKKKTRVKNALNKVLMKMSIKFSAELLLLMVAAMYMVGKFLNAEKIEDKPEETKPATRRPQRKAPESKPELRTVKTPKEKTEKDKTQKEKVTTEKPKKSSVSADLNQPMFG